MAEKEEKEQKVTIEREYVVPLREEWLKVPKYKRANKAVKALKEFMVRHMKVYDRDLRKIKIDILLNNELRFRGMKKPLGKVKVKAIKYENGEVAVKLVNLPKHIEFELARKAKKEAEKLKTEKEKPKEEKIEEKKEEEKTESEKKEEKEKTESSKEAMLATEKQQAKQMAHTSKTQQEIPKIQRKALKR
jgi:large subunit ribosomal protein L31e